MGKSLPSPTKLQEFARIVSSDRFHSPKHPKPISKFRLKSPESPKPKLAVRVDSGLKKMDVSEGSQQNQRIPLAEVVSDCVKRWFQDTLKEAKSGDSAMQVLVGQMYYSGYGVPRDDQKGRAWINRASKSRSSVWKVCDKQPGYNASDSDSDDTKADAK